MRSASFFAAAALGAATCVLLQPSARAQGQTDQKPQAPLTFRSATNLVEVDVIVLDKQGRFVPGLTADDLQVFEDGHLQQIEQFYLVSSVGGGTTPQRQQAAEPADTRGRRILVFFFDEEHLTNESLLRVKTGVERFLATQFHPGDIGGVFTNATMYHGRLTGDRNEVLAGVRAVRPAFENRERLLRDFRDFPPVPSENVAMRIDYGDNRLLDEVVDAACTLNPDECAGPVGRQRVTSIVEDKVRTYMRSTRDETERTIANLRLVAANLSTVPGRKTVVFLSNGFFSEEVRSEVQQIAAIAARGGTTFYSVYGRGASMVAGREIPDVLSPEAGVVSTFDTVDDGPEVLSAGTGGFVIRNMDDISRALGLVARDTSTYYVMGYQPLNANLDGKVRKIEVKAKADGLKVRARKGYVALPLPPMQTLRIAGSGGSGGFSR